MKRRGTWTTVAVVVAVGIGVGWWGYSQAREFASLAGAGKADASAALASLRKDDPAAATASFEKAEAEFASARALLGPEWLHVIPLLGHQLAAADDLATIGAEGSSAGSELTRLMTEAGEVTGDNRLTRLVALAGPRLESALTSLAVVSDRQSGLSPDGLVAPLADAVSQVRELVAPYSGLLGRAPALLELQRYLFSGDHTFLVVAQNSSELRPTGGFMGTFGMLRFGPAGFTLDSFSDIYTLPRDTLNEPLPDGGQVNDNHFYFRNTNWWMDFPTSTTMMLKFWENMQQPKVDGIVAVDIPMLQALLKVYGPVTIPETSTPVTAENAMALLNMVVHFEHSGQDDRSLRKLAIVSLVDSLFGQVSALPADKAIPTLEALVGAANGKHIQVYFTDTAAQAAMVDAGWSGAIAPPAGTTDLLAVSNGVIKPSKANYGVTKSLAYQVALAEDGSADTTLTLGYTKSDELLLGVPQQWLANYVRVHRLAGTVADTDSGFESLVDRTGLPTFGQYFRLDPGESHEVALDSVVPRALAAADASGQRHYGLLVAKQADLVETEASVTVSAPAGWKVVTASARFRVSGTEVPVVSTGAGVTVNTALSEDLLLDVTLARN
ncbi:MAG: DUF4012 domain-containing protein [Propionicimonas sp.]|uniref:DUF4012 domain-containing protein n=1 Tax=Propionicimonas sp. TaxID=1955623 RepID=UPI003D0CA580